MGVINITPNSFSDTKNQPLVLSQLKKNITKFSQNKNIILDFGFESTAPMNTAITALEERARFDDFIVNIEDIDLSECWISFDTYRPSNYQYFEDQFSARFLNCGYIFNDVSGVIDLELIDFLKKKRHQENFYYLHASTHIPSRDNVLNHMQYINEGDVLKMCEQNFKEAYEEFRAIGFEKKIIFDPCFGFSKSYEQNWDLINHFDELLVSLGLQGIKTPWLIGLSKKSFLRKALPESIDSLIDPFEQSEILHQKLIKELKLKTLNSNGPKAHLIFRVHDPEIVERVYAGL